MKYITQAKDGIVDAFKYAQAKVGTDTVVIGLGGAIEAAALAYKASAGSSLKTAGASLLNNVALLGITKLSSFFYDKCAHEKVAMKIGEIGSSVTEGILKGAFDAGALYAVHSNVAKIETSCGMTSDALKNALPTFTAFNLMKVVAIEAIDYFSTQSAVEQQPTSVTEVPSEDMNPEINPGYNNPQPQD